jgi:hypothetical protein
MLLDEMRLEGGGDFVGRLQRLVDGPVPRGVVDHMASILRGRPALQSHITVAHYSCGMAGEQAAGRVDSWIWSVRLTKTRSVRGLPGRPRKGQRDAGQASAGRASR